MPDDRMPVVSEEQLNKMLSEKSDPDFIEECIKVRDKLSGMERAWGDFFEKNHDAIMKEIEKYGDKNSDSVSDWQSISKMEVKLKWVPHIT